ncbi:MAG: hypothetical protein JO202_11605 [Ktedonobacteraceae bacterium]|nr:hypothetical protein [Ktedonobacteraceae bacterium]
MSLTQTWRDMLANLIDEPGARRCLADAIGVAPITLLRWVKKETSPRPHSLYKLLDALNAQQRARLLPLIEQEYPGLSFSAHRITTGKGKKVVAIPVELYERALHTSATISDRLRFSSLCDLILREALAQLDPESLGMAVIVACCMPPSGEKVCSLRESTGRGTPPWKSHLEEWSILLGAESLAGSAVVSGRLQVNQDFKGRHSIAPGYQDRWEQSAAAAPIMRSGKIAAVLLVSSMQLNYFSSDYCQLVENYAQLLTLAFAPTDFYEPQRIQLAVMPFAEFQRPYVAQFQQRFKAVMMQHAQDEQPFTSLQAEQIAWQQIERELLHLPLQAE